MVRIGLPQAAHSALNDAALTATDHRELMRATAAAAVPRLGDWCAVSYLTHPGMPPETEIVHSDPARVDWARELQLRYPYDPDATSGVAAVMRRPPSRRGTGSWRVRRAGPP